VDSLVIFSRKAVGDVTPDRELHTPHGTLGSRSTRKAKELFSAFSMTMLLWFTTRWRKDTKLQSVWFRQPYGLADPHGMVLDDKKKLLFVAIMVLIMK